jgi:uridine kinase
MTVCRHNGGVVLRLYDGELPARSWQVLPLVEVFEQLLPKWAAGDQRTPVVAVDGRSASGKTTLAGRLASVVPGACVVHTDDIAWWHSRFGWQDLLIEGVLKPFRTQGAVDYRPPAWNERGREGSVIVPAGTTLLIVEGVGAGRIEVASLLDGIVYVQVDADVAAQRELARNEAGETTASGTAGWLAEEHRFVAEQRPWDRANLITTSNGDVPYDSERELLVATGSLTDG